MKNGYLMQFGLLFEIFDSATIGQVFFWGCMTYLLRYFDILCFVIYLQLFWVALLE